MRKCLTIALLLFSFWSFGQHGLAFYNLRNGTFQNSNYNPAYIPQGKFFLGLPAISGINFYVNSRFSYNRAVSEDESGSLFYDVDEAIDAHGISNIVSANVHLSLFHIGFRLPEDGPVITLFVNERIESDFTYPKSLLEWAWDGNGSFLGRNMNFNSLGLSSNYFREYGIGLATKVPDRPITVGARVKMYQGIVNVSTPASMRVRFKTHQDDFSLNLTTNNTVVRTAGIETLQGGNPVPYLINNSNKGAGIDLGMEYRINRYYQVALSATDLGFISWKEGIKNYAFKDTTARYAGVQLRGSRNLERAFQDSVLTEFDVEENEKTYLAPMVGKLTGSWIYTPMKGVDVISTVHTRIVQNQPKMAYGVGVRGFLSPKVIGAMSLTKVPQQWVNIGASFALTAGVVQFYAAADKVLGYSVPDMRWAEFRIGMNLVFGNGDKKRGGKDQYQDFGPITESKGVISNTFLGQPVKVKRQDGIYTVIKKQKDEEPSSITSKVRKNDYLQLTNRSATGSIVNNDKVRRKLESATGKTDRSARTGRKTHSATGTVNTSERPGRRFHSATGQNRNDHRRVKRLKSATGQVNNSDRSGRRFHSATGTVNTSERPGRRFHSATGENRNDHGSKRKIKSATGKVDHSKRKGSVNRSATGKVDHGKPKGRVTRSATGQNRSDHGGQRKIKSATGKNRNSKAKKRKKG